MTGPPTWPPPAGQPAPQPVGRQLPPTRPPDVDTGFWLWLTALPVLTTGYVVDLLASPALARTTALYPAVGLLAVVVCVVVVTFLLLMRSGYRWARGALTGGGIAAVVYAVNTVIDVDERPVVAVVSAVTAIVGSVLVVGGTFLLHRSDAQAYFTR